jgi:hypothetical protein
MKHFYDNQDDDMRSKFNKHEFDIPNGAWENMEKKLDRLEVPSMTKNLAPWLSLGTMCIGIAALLYYYQLQMPFGKTAEIVKTEQSILKNKVLSESEFPINESKSADIVADKKDKVPTSSENIKSNIAKSANGTKTSQSRIIEPANLSQSIKSERANLTTPPKKLEPTAFNTDNTYNSNNTFIADRNSSNVINSDNKAISDEQLPTVLKNVALAQNLSLLNIERKTIQSLKSNIDTPLLALKTPHPVPVKKMRFGIGAGVNTKVFADNDFSIAPAAGIFVRRNINSRYALQADLQYKMLTKNRLNKTEEASLMSMQLDVAPGAEILMQQRTAEVYSIKEMHMIELPLSFVYRLHKKHHVSLGINAACLFGVKTRNTAINNLSEKELGFSSLDLGAIAGYEFNLNKNISIAVSYNVGFLNLAKNVNARQQVMMDANPAYRMSNNETDEACLMPIQLNNQEQVFFEAPTHLYNKDAKILLRYSF